MIRESGEQLSEMELRYHATQERVAMGVRRRAVLDKKSKNVSLTEFLVI